MIENEDSKSWEEYIEQIYDYVVLNKYPQNCSKGEKRNIRKKSNPFIAKSGELYHTKQDSNSNVIELLVIRETKKYSDTTISQKYDD